MYSDFLCDDDSVEHWLHSDLYDMEFLQWQLQRWTSKLLRLLRKYVVNPQKKEKHNEEMQKCAMCIRNIRKVIEIKF